MIHSRACFSDCANVFVCNSLSGPKEADLLTMRTHAYRARKKYGCRILSLHSGIDEISPHGINLCIPGWLYGLVTELAIKYI